MNYSSIEYQELLNQTSSLQKQISDMSESVSALQENAGTVSLSIEDIQAQANSNAGMINLLDNTEFSFDVEGYNGATGADKNEYCAEWYVRPQATADFIKHTFPSTYSSQGLKRDISLDNYWNDVGGYAQIGGGYALGQEFDKNFFTSGNKIYVRFEASKEVGAVIDAGVILRASIWDNSTGQKKILEGAVKVITASTQGTTGAFTREYILEVVTPSGTFYSDITTPADVTDALSVDNLTSPSTNYVEVSWDAVLEQSQYRLYRYDSEYAEWRIIAQITNGATSFRDTGGRTGAIFTVPSSQVNPKAVAQIIGFGAKVLESPRATVMAIRVPSTYVFADTDPNNQWFQLELLKDDETDSTTTEVPERSIIIDKVGVSFANGRYVPSNNDQITSAPIIASAPPVSSGGGAGGGYIPSEGGGGYGGEIGCVLPDVLIKEINPLTYQIRDIMAKDVVVGMCLVGKKPNGKVSFSKVKSVFKGNTRKYYNIITGKGYSLPCSASHPIIQNLEDTKGIFAHNINLTYTDSEIELLVSDDGKSFEKDYVESVDVFIRKTDIVTFEMEDDTATFISNNVVSHNLRAKEEYYY